MDVPDVRYARAGGVAIAYQIVGNGTPDVVYAPHRRICGRFGPVAVTHHFCDVSPRMCG